MDVDVVMLSYTKDREIFDMTCEALNSLDESELAYRFNVVLVETNTQYREQGFDYTGLYAIKVITPDIPFNYNAYLNIGFQHISQKPYDAPLVVIANNDLLFRKGWFSRLHNAIEQNRLDVASPRSPGWHVHEEHFPKTGVYIGTRTSFEVCGWCLCVWRNLLEEILPLDERFRFEFQDVDFVDQLIKLGHNRMGLVCESEVVHLLNKSHRLIESRDGMIEGAREIYLGKQNER